MKFQIKLRKFRLSDLKTILKIERSSFSIDAYSKKRFKSLWKYHPNNFILAEIKDKIVGYIIAYPRKDFGDFNSVAVDKKYRNLGIGKKLVNFMLEKFKKLGLKRAFLEVRTKNKITISFYRNLGFKIIKIIKNFYKDGGNAYRMVKTL